MAPAITPTTISATCGVMAASTGPMPPMVPADAPACSMAWCRNGVPCVRMPPPTMNMATVPSTASSFISFGAAASRKRPKPRSRPMPLPWRSVRYRPASSILTMPATMPYTPTVMMAAMAISTATCWLNGALDTVPSEMTMISADRMKSVRMAPWIFSFSSAHRSMSGLATAAASSAWCWASSSGLCRNLWASFSNPSKHRKAPPIISSGVMAHGAKALMASAAGTRIALFFSEPTATAHTTGSSRSALTPATCWALRARSSPSTPAVFFAATLLMAVTSSRMVAISSIRASRLVPAIGGSLSGEVVGPAILPHSAFRRRPRRHRFPYNIVFFRKYHHELRHLDRFCPVRHPDRRLAWLGRRAVDVARPVVRRQEGQRYRDGPAAGPAAGAVHRRRRRRLAAAGLGTGVQYRQDGGRAVPDLAGPVAMACQGGRRRRTGCNEAGRAAVHGPARADGLPDQCHQPERHHLHGGRAAPVHYARPARAAAAVDPGRDDGGHRHDGDARLRAAGLDDAGLFPRCARHAHAEPCVRRPADGRRHGAVLRQARARLRADVSPAWLLQ